MPEMAMLKTRVTHTQNGPYRSGLGLMWCWRKDLPGRGTMEYNTRSFTAVVSTSKNCW